MRFSIILLACLLILPGIVLSQEVVVTGFPIGVGRSVESDFFKPYHDDLKMIADTLRKYPLAKAVITGGADGEVYRTDDNTKNPALALGRAHALRNYISTQFQINPDQFVINSEEVTKKGPNGRYASIRISQESINLAIILARLQVLENNNSMDDALARIDALEKKPPIEKHFTEVRDTTRTFSDRFGLQVSAGFTTSPFGGMPLLAGAVTWERNLFLEAFVGHTFWTNDFTFKTLSLDVKKRMIGGQVVAYPLHNKRIGFLGGWVRVEEISSQYYEYVKMSEGLLLGMKYTIFDNITLSASYNPSKHNLISEQFAQSKNGQFMFSVTFSEIFGGAK